MNTRKIVTTAVAALFALGTLTACGAEDQAADEPTTAVEPEVEETVELDPKKMTGALDAEQTAIFTKEALTNHGMDICEMVHFTLPKDDLRGVVNLVMDVAGYGQGVESLSTLGVLHYRVDECDD